MEPKSKKLEDGCVTPSIDEESINGLIYENVAQGRNNLVYTNSGDNILEPKHKVFLSHSGVQKDFVEQLCVDLERYDRYPFFDKRRNSLPIGEKFPKLIFDAIKKCQVGVLILSEEFFMETKWPMIELAAMVKEYKRRDSNIKIIPVFYHMLNLKNHTQWISQWEKWASTDARINVEEWKTALEVLEPITSLIMTNNMGEVDFRKEIVSAVCNWVHSETRLDDSYVQGRLHLCKAVCEKIYEHTQYNGVRVIGLHGIGGIGKTTICKAMCNEMFHKFHGNVCHIELKNSNEAQILREVLKRLTKITSEMLHGLNIDECRNQLKRCIVNQPVFLTIDNVSDDLEVIKQAKTFLGVRWNKGSVIIVTARSLDELLRLKPYINKNDCMEMPELKEDDAMSLFLNHVTANKHDITTKMDKELLKRCVERCYFSKREGKGHYIPLALEVLGQELRCVEDDADLWDAQLKKVDMFEKELSGKHPIFSILRTSFDSLSPQAQMLFMDVALFLPCLQYQSWHWGCYLKCNVFEWLSMVHGSSVKVKDMLKRLKRKSLLEDLGEGWTKIGMHDLWLEFCVAETKFRERRWVFLEEESTELSCGLKELKRMCFLNEGWRVLQEVNFEDCVNVSVLKVNIGWFVQPSMLDLDLKGLKHLKSLELKANKFIIKCVGFGSLRNLVELRWWADKASSPCIEEIGSLTKLQVLEIKGFVGDKLPDLNMLTSLHVVCFAHCDNVETITGLSANLSNLRCLCISRCLKLRECPSLGELYALEELDLWGCKKLQELPCLGLLTKLSRLNISECELVREVPELSDLLALKELRAKGCSGLGHLPDLHKLTELEILWCTDLSEMDLLDLSEFLQLKEWVSGWCTALKSVNCSKCLFALKVIDLTLCMSLEELPDLRNFPNLVELVLGGCARLMSLTSSEPLNALRILDLEGCRKLGVLPDHLSSSTDLRVLRLQKSGIMLSGEDIRKLEASCKNLVVFSGSAPSKYGDEYGYPTDVTGSDRSEDKFDDLETNVHNQYRSRRLWDPLPRKKVSRLIFSNIDGSLIQKEGAMNLLALTSSGMHKRWDWKNMDTVNFAPQLWRPAGGVLMINDISDTILEEVGPCSMALCRDDYHLYMLSASGGNVSFFTMMTDKFGQEAIQQALPSKATYLAFYPQDNDILAIGMEDSTIAICNEYEKKVVCTLKGHQKRITGLVFSKCLRKLVSLGADAQLCLWRTDRWARRQLNFVQEQPDERLPCAGGIRIQFHNDEVQLLVVCESRLAVYDALKLDRHCQWNCQHPFPAAISDATYSSDSQLVYVSFADGSVGILDAKSLRPQCRLASPIHTPRRVSGSTAYPTAIAANPVRRNQFALGMSDGDVLVVGPLDAEWKDEETIEVMDESTKEVRMDKSEDELKITKDPEMARCDGQDFFFGFFGGRSWQAKCLQIVMWLAKVSLISLSFFRIRSWRARCLQIGMWLAKVSHLFLSSFRMRSRHARCLQFGMWLTKVSLN